MFFELRPHRLGSGKWDEWVQFMLGLCETPIITENGSADGGERPRYDTRLPILEGKDGNR